MKAKNEKHPNSNGTAKKPATPKSPNGGKKPCSVQGLPTPYWSQKQLVEAARYQWGQLQAAEKKAAVHVFRLGAALVLLKPSLKKQRRWAKFLKDLHISEATAWRATELFTRAKTEEQVAFLTITEAYEKFGIIAQPQIPADNDDDGKNAAETGGKMKAAPKNVKGKKTAPNFAAVKDLGGEQEEAAYEEVGQDEADHLNSDHRTTKKKQSDEYYTPDNAIALLLPYLPKGKVIGEVAWGQGHIARYLQSHGHTVVGGPDKDFLTDAIEAQIYVTNPPFSRRMTSCDGLMNWADRLRFFFPPMPWSGWSVTRSSSSTESNS